MIKENETEIVQLKILREDLFVLAKKYPHFLVGHPTSEETKIEKAFCSLIWEIDVRNRSLLRADNLITKVGERS